MPSPPKPDDAYDGAALVPTVPNPDALPRLGVCRNLARMVATAQLRPSQGTAPHRRAAVPRKRFGRSSRNHHASQITASPAMPLIACGRPPDARVSSPWTGRVNVNRGYTPNGLNQYGAVGSAAYCYDANGNLTYDGISAYRYDMENRLVEKRSAQSSTCPTATSGYGGTLLASLRYDPNGRLYETIGQTTGTTRFLYDGDNLVAEYDGGGNLLRRYAHGANASADDPLFWFEGATTSWTAQRQLVADQQGSIVAIGLNDGTNLAINSYDEYGIPYCPLVGGMPDCSAAGANKGRFGYTGQVWIAELGLWYYKARFYSPILGRFMQTDPIGYKDQMNLYGYVGNDPMDRVDYSGRSGECVINGDGTKTCTIVVTGPRVGVILTVAAVGIWNAGYRGLRALEDLGGRILQNASKGPTAQEGTDKDWEEATDGAEKGPDSEFEKDGGKEQAEKDFDKLNGAEVTKDGSGARVKILPDGTKAVLRPSSSGRPTLERQPPRGAHNPSGSRRTVRYNP